MRIISIITAVLLFSMLSGGSARAVDCIFDGRSHWEIGDYLYFEQSNGFHVQMTVYRSPANPTFFTGQAIAWSKSAPRGNEPLRGAVSGFTLDHRIQFSIYWGPRSGDGEYMGLIHHNGMAFGETHQFGNWSSAASWTATLPMQCRPDNPRRAVTVRSVENLDQGEKSEGSRE
jgi:hypothetical protein